MNITSQFINLVKIASPSGKEGAMSVYLQSWLKNNNFEFKIDHIGNIYARNNKQGIPLLLCAHMDTVQPGENIHPVIENGIIKSDGQTILGADNKASLAAMLTAIETATPKKNLELLFTVREETGGGIELFPSNWIQSKKALVFDSANPLGGIVLRSPYISNFEITIEGASAHSSTPQLGKNAFTPAIQFLSELSVGELDEGETTINIGLINGGTGINTIPDHIHLQGEIRSYQKVLFEKHIGAIEKAVQKSAAKYDDTCTFHLNGYCAGYTHQKKNPFVKSISSILSLIELQPVFYTYSGISDANVLNSKGIETLNLTDGVQFPHTKQEQIYEQDLAKLGELIKKCIEKL